MKYIELELIDGTHVAVENDWSKIYDVREKLYRTGLKLSFRFPFISWKKAKCISFRYMTQYVTLTSVLDPKYVVKCSLIQFMNMFGVSVKPFEMALIESDLTV